VIIIKEAIKKTKEKLGAINIYINKSHKNEKDALQ
jgi:hypothetical protein